MATIDPHRTWEPLEQRLADTTDHRHRIVLSAVIDHMKAEAEPDLDALMATLSETPEYHFWNAGADRGPKGIEGVRRYYTDFLATRTNILEFDIDRIVVDDYCVVTDGFLKQIYSGSYAARVGLPVDDESADYLVTYRQLILWPVDEDGRIIGEDSYRSGPAEVKRLRPVSGTSPS